MKKLISYFLAAILTLSAVGMEKPVKAKGAVSNVEKDSYDIVVYGGTASGIMAAVQARKMGKSVAVIEPGVRIGGMTTGGLCATDVGNENAIGGLALEFYQRVGKKYGEAGAVWRFEPKVALEVLEDYVKENNIPVFYKERLDLKNGVTKNGVFLVSIKMESGKAFNAKIFIDATYEGDLMAKAGVSYTVGREDNSLYNETINGIRNANEHNAAPNGIDPYIKKGDPSSGLIARVNTNAGGEVGKGDKKVQAYNFRWVLTKNPANRVMVQKPDGYNEADYEILFRAIEAGQMDNFFKTGSSLPNEKVDANNASGVSTDYIGMSNDYPEGDYETRAKIIKAHEMYQRGLLWTLQNHPRIPREIKDQYKEWGLAKDEFTENANWPTQLYIREARRMVGEFVTTQNVAQLKEPVNDSVGMGSYAMDSHHIQYYVNESGNVVPEGDMMTRLTQPYPVSYRSIVPKATECLNLLIPVCISATHAAYGSVRMEPVFMVLGQSAATIASMAIDENIAVQKVEYKKLSEKLKADNQVIDFKKSADKNDAAAVPPAPTPTLQPSSTLSGTVEQQAESRLKNAVILLTGSSNAMVNNTMIKIDNENNDVKPVEQDGRTLVPVRFISESLKADVLWNADESAATVELDGKEVKFVIGSRTYTVNGMSKEMDVAAQTIGGRTVLPLCAVAEAFGRKVFWDERGLIAISQNDNLLDSVQDSALIEYVIGKFIK